VSWITKNPKDLLYIDYLIHPVPIAAVIVTGLNDHYFKYKFPGWITGKLSDICGVFYFPLFLIAGFSLLVNLIKYSKIKQGITRPFYINSVSFFVCAFLTGILMGFIKLSNFGNAFVNNYFSKLVFEIQITKDPSDMLALIMLPLTYQYLRKFLKASI
jgi:hypothetical protein